MNSIQMIIRERKSVRTFNGTPLCQEDRERLVNYISTLDNPFGIPVTFRFLDAKECGLSSPVIVGTDLYLAAKVERVPRYEIAYGYSFEKFCLYARSLGIGTVMLAATISRGAFEKAMEVKVNEVLPLASPVGYPAERRSVRENLMRKGIKADSRLPFEELFFDGSFENTLSVDRAGKFAEAFEMLRLAPSAGNKQPWRVVLNGDTVHFYEKKSLPASALGDIQKVDIGIALSHFDLTLKESGLGGSFLSADPEFSVEDGIEYVISFTLQ